MKALIDHTLTYSLTWILAYMLGGIFWYIIDRQYFTGLVARWHNLTHETPLEKQDALGIIHGRKAARLFVIATMVSTLESIVTFFFTAFHSNPFIELVLWVIVIPFMVLGFYLGRAIFPLWQKRGKVYDAIDHLDERLEKRGRTSVTPTTEDRGPSMRETTVTEVPQEDPRDLINKFTKQ